MLWLLHLMNFDPILKSTDGHLVTKYMFSVLFRLITVNIHNFVWNEIGLHIKIYNCLTVVHFSLFLNSMTFDLISGLHIQIQTWHLLLWLSTHAKYYVKSDLINVLKNANKTKNMHLFLIRIANYQSYTWSSKKNTYLCTWLNEMFTNLYTVLWFVYTFFCKQSLQINITILVFWAEYLSKIWVISNRDVRKRDHSYIYAEKWVSHILFLKKMGLIVYLAALKRRAIRHADPYYVIYR